MRIISMLYLALSALPAFASQPVRSIHDLPQKWTGVAGDMFLKLPATFMVHRVVKVEREGGNGGLPATYQVEATMTLGLRKIAIQRISLQASSYLADYYEMYLQCDDELVSGLGASILYDEASNTFTLKEMSHMGLRRFSFSAPAPALRRTYPVER